MNEAKKKAKSGNPAVRAQAPKQSPGTSSVSDFKKLKKGRPLLLPSGLTMICRRVELGAFIRRGEVPNPLLPIIEEALNKGKGMDTDAFMDENELNMDMINEMYALVDQIVVELAVNPQVHPLPTHDEDGDELEDDDAVQAEKDDDLLYVDEIEDEDKMFLFQWCTGGTEDVATFRSEAQASLADLGQGKGNGKKSKRGNRS